MAEMELIEFFEVINVYLPIFMSVFSLVGAVAMAMALSRAIIGYIVRAFASEEMEAEKNHEGELWAWVREWLSQHVTIAIEKKSYEEEMAVYDNETVQPLSLPASLSLEDLLSEDGEIPDRFIQG